MKTFFFKICIVHYSHHPCVRVEWHVKPYCLLISIPHILFSFPVLCLLSSYLVPFNSQNVSTLSSSTVIIWLKFEMFNQQSTVFIVCLNWIIGHYTCKRVREMEMKKSSVQKESGGGVEFKITLAISVGENQAQSKVICRKYSPR